MQILINIRPLTKVPSTPPPTPPPLRGYCAYTSQITPLNPPVYWGETGMISCPLDYLLNLKNPTPPKLCFVSPPEERGGVGGGVQ